LVSDQSRLAADAGSIPAASIIDRSPLRLTPQHDDFGRFLVLAASLRKPTPAKPASAAL
jgi:hypothetical protein